MLKASVLPSTPTLCAAAALLIGAAALLGSPPALARTSLSQSGVAVVIRFSGRSCPSGEVFRTDEHRCVLRIPPVAANQNCTPGYRFDPQSQHCVRGPATKPHRPWGRSPEVTTDFPGSGTPRPPFLPVPEQREPVPYQPVQQPTQQRVPYQPVRQPTQQRVPYQPVPRQPATRPAGRPPKHSKCHGVCQ